MSGFEKRFSSEDSEFSSAKDSMSMMLASDSVTTPFSGDALAERTAQESHQAKMRSGVRSVGSRRRRMASHEA